MDISLRTLVIALLVAGSTACKSSQTPPPATAPERPLSPPSPEPAYSDLAEDRVEALEAYRATATRIWDLVHTKLEVSFNWQQQAVEGAATLELTPHFYPQQQLVLDAQGFTLKNVQLLDGSSFADLDYSYNGQQINIDLGKPVPRKESVFVYIEYTARPAAIPAGGSAAITSDQGLYFINPLGTEANKPRQIWTQGETQSNSKWFPTIDAPNQKMTQEVYITLNSKYKSLSNGTLIHSTLVNDSTRTDYWRMDQPHAPYLLMMAIGEFAVVEDADWNGKPITYYVEPEFEAYAKNIFGNTPEMITYFSELLGYDYPWDKYAQVVVRDFVSGAMENTTASVFMEDLQVDDRYLLDNNWDDIIAHELFHQWFGDLVTCESWSNLPLNESFANYSEYLWAEYKYGPEAAAEFILNERASYFREAESKQVDLIRYYYDDREDMFDSHSYAKGGQILHMLRNYVGDEAFFASLNRYLNQHAFKPVEVHDLRLAFEQVTGEDLNWFFNQWFMGSGHPQLKVRSQYQNGELILTVDQTQDLSTTPLYRLPVYVDIFSGGTVQRYALEVGAATEFRFKVDSDPDLVLFDPEQQLLAKIDHPKNAAQLSFQYSNAEHLLARHQAIAQLADLDGPAAVKVAQQALRDSVAMIRRLALGILAETENLDFRPYEQAIAQLASSDESTLVRADAISILASANPNAYREQFRKGLEEPSYSVVAASAYGYGYTDAEDRTERLSRLEGYTNEDVVLVLADYYVANAVPDKAYWFKEKISSLQGGALAYTVNYLGQYLLAAKPEVVRREAQLLKDLALNHSDYYIRLAAYNALQIQTQLPDLEAQLKQIREAESNPRLKQYYQSYE